MTFQVTGLDLRFGRVAALLPLLLVVALANGGCSLAIVSHDIEATDLKPVHVGATRAEVEEVLGSPVASEAKGTQYVVTYEFDRGQLQEDVDESTMRTYLEIYGPFWEPILTPISLIDLARRINEQKGRLPVTYGPDDTVIRLGPPEVGGAAWKAPKKKQPCC